MQEYLTEYTPQQIEEAATETDSTIYELLCEVDNIRNDKTIPYTQRANHLYNWISNAEAALADYLKEQEQENNTCIVCQGSGGIPETPCYRCGGSGEERGRGA